MSIEGDKRTVVEAKSKADAIIRHAEIEFAKQKDNPEYVRKLHGDDAYLRSLGEEDTKLPSYWKLYKGKLTSFVTKMKGDMFSKVDVKLQNAVESMMTKSWKSHLVGQGRDATNQTRTNVKIQQIWQIENPDLYNDYIAKRKKFCLGAVGNKVPRLSSVQNQNDFLTKSFGIAELDALLVHQINEVFLFHGTSASNKEAIVKQGLDARIGNSSGMFGQGIYFAESATKADQYSHNGTIPLQF